MFDCRWHADICFYFYKKNCLKFIVLLASIPVALTCSLYAEDSCWCES